MTERERLIKLLKNVQLPRKAKNPYASLADYLLANGVVVPVRCRECIYNEMGNCTKSEDCNMDYDPLYYCADGERRADNGT